MPAATTTDSRVRQRHPRCVEGSADGRMRNETRRSSRLLADKRPVELEFEIVNRSYPEGAP